ncbi:TPA: hypothetical protein EYO12_03520 [Candidatus Saccharibacteria bacterium]|nr:hypothetical protein [Candidatus Saccharibacteria bacterium]HIO87900.1 hypothetical protein [Candidatus Saccharibacteria bacterium]
MHIYFSGIGGKGIASLAHIALDAGYTVSGSDLSASATTTQLAERGATITFNQSGEFLEELTLADGIDWLIYTAAMQPDHPELESADRLGIPFAKRHEFINTFLHDKYLKLLAVSGTHGKTTTTSMVVWLFKKHNIPVSYSIGGDLSFGNGGAYQKNSDWLVLEADEFDKNMLYFAPDEAVVVNIDYDHKDTYPTRADYEKSFEQFIKQSKHTVLWDDAAAKISVDSKKHTVMTKDSYQPEIPLAGQHNRENAVLASHGFMYATQPDSAGDPKTVHSVLRMLADFPGAKRRMERIAKNVYSDFAHTPEEITATLQLASEKFENIIVIYQPHQNIRQHELVGKYETCFEKANKVYWVPTYLSREKPDQEVLSPKQLIPKKDHGKFEISELNDNLAAAAKSMANDYTILCMGAGDIDDWARNNLG